MTFVLMTFALLATTTALMLLCVSRLNEATAVVGGLSTDSWIDTSARLRLAAEEVEDQISRSQASWAK
ncbi:MAG TPA: hypothetical protein VL068_01445 [Microthrixaceae bacterium]|nr:hypothetical protein [Microthrixaceae bacterium]